MEELARAVAYAAALRVTRFHTQNDHGDWDVVHHAFTAANAVHQLLGRTPRPELTRGVYQGAIKVYLDRFLNVPAARCREPASPPKSVPDLTGLQACWDQQDMVDEAGASCTGGWVGGIAGRGAGRPRIGVASRGRRISLVPDVRGRGPPVVGVAGRLRAGVRSSWPERLASWPPTRRHAGSCRKWYASLAACGAANPSTRPSRLWTDRALPRHRRRRRVELGNDLPRTTPRAPGVNMSGRATMRGLHADLGQPTVAAHLVVDRAGAQLARSPAQVGDPLGAETLDHRG